MVSKEDPDYARELANKNFVKKEIDNPPENMHPDDYARWVRSKSYTIPREEVSDFLSGEFHKANDRLKNSFLIVTPDIINYMHYSVVARYLTKLHNIYLKAIYSSHDFNSFSVSGILAIFMSVFKYTNRKDLKILIDSMIKNSIGSYPIHISAQLAVKMIKSEQIYIPSSSFDINHYIYYESNDNVKTEEVEKLF
uniref:Uncharacterized protein n=1 Tax=Candidatus Kentrum sp. LPFa TaxID=2126335 RepID=A0A450WLL9_9GAMM|nr:MAG: hypothetical protein BECKLPF1236B_GA0070989_11295 [Candidatus Kentron sp. LPFa]